MRLLYEYSSHGATGRLASPTGDGQVPRSQARGRARSERVGTMALEVACTLVSLRAARPCLLSKFVLPYVDKFSNYR